MKRIIALLALAASASVAVPGVASADRGRDDRRPREERREPLSDTVRDLNQNYRGGCVYSRTLPDGRQVFRCEVAPGRYVDRIIG